MGAARYGNATLGGVMGDFLGATICMTEVAVLLALAADPAPFRAFANMAAAAATSDGGAAGWWKDAVWDARAAAPLAGLVGTALLPTLYGRAVRWCDGKLPAGEGAEGVKC